MSSMYTPGSSRFPVEITFQNANPGDQPAPTPDKKAILSFNKAVREWGRRVDADLRPSASRFMKENRRLLNSLRQNYKHYGKAPSAEKEISSIGFRFVEEGIFTHIGVGRGYNMENGTRILTKKTNHDWNREPMPWFNPVVEKHIPDLQRIVANYSTQMVVNATRIFIHR